MMQIVLDAGILIPMVYVLMMLFLWLFPPRWIKQMGDTAIDWINDLKQWAPRLVGAVRWDKQEETKEAAVKEGSPLTQTLMMVAELAPLIERLPTILQALNATGLLSGELSAPEGEVPKTRQKAGGAVF